MLAMGNSERVNKFNRQRTFTTLYAKNTTEKLNRTSTILNK